MTRLTTKEASAYTGLAEQTLATMRSQRRGPKYLKLSNRVFYRQNDLDEYLDSCLIDPAAPTGNESNAA
ncbi:helix-turn-helix domain-containing protein [Pseudodesulfovibrio indicus]|uniref:helix-turn-helix transcriptional regulator n=1 Tax=Pseudodesulfovibrio indicus TaxID=1716143 RepID=UPI00292D605A|nr:helix-turn-helix domain-containing protein [Pseudodesulfovibrio indicus]